MNYTLSKTTIIGQPKIVKIEEVDTLVIPTGVFTKIVGQNYSGFEAFDKVEVPFLQTDNLTQMKAKQDAFASAFIENKYPNT